jgi:hypothetical protein
VVGIQYAESRFGQFSDGLALVVHDAVFEKGQKKQKSNGDEQDQADHGGQDDSQGHPPLGHGEELDGHELHLAPARVKAL